MTIRKPPEHFGRRSPRAAAVETFATGTVRAVRATRGVAQAGTYLVRGLVCWAFALLWGFAALAAGMAGGLPSLIGVGAMAAGMGWLGTRLLAKARAASGW